MINFTEYAENFDSIREALEAADADEFTINKYADPVEGERLALTVEEALEIAREDAGLLWIDDGSEDNTDALMAEDNIRREILEIGGSPANVLVSLHRETREAVWGEVCALPREEMEREMASIGYDTAGMMTGEEYLAR